MNKERFLYLILIGSILSNILLVYYVVCKPTPPSFHPDKPKQIIIHALGFDAEQQREYEQLIAQHRKDIKQLDETIVALKKELYKNLIQSDSVRADSISYAIGLVQTKIERVHYHHFEDIKSICRSNQQSKFESLTKELNKIFSHPKPMFAPKK